MFRVLTKKCASPDPLTDEAQVDSYYRQQRTAYEGYLTSLADNRFLHSPQILSIETLVKCNATCEFCPYPTSGRIGQRLDTEIIHKIIDDVSESEIAPDYFVPARINEPLFDRRMFAIFEYAATRLPSTKIGHFTNGTTLSERNVDRLASAPTLGFINVSLNSHEPDEHRRLMGIDFALVIKNLRTLHRVYGKLNPKWLVHLSRVGDGTIRDIRFMQWCATEFPLFQSRTLARFDWLGKTHALDLGAAPPACSQWYSLNFLADGREALCCIDDDGRFGRGDAKVENALSIYNHPVRLALRETRLRSSHPACKACRALI